MARKRHSDPYKALHDLLDQYERSSSVSRTISAFPSQSFSTADGEATFRSIIKSAEINGAVRLEMDRGDMSHLMKRIVLENPDALFAFLSRTPRSSVVSDSKSAILDLITPSLAPTRLQIATSKLEDMERSWQKGQAHYRMHPSDISVAVEYLQAWSAVLTRDPDDPRDLRTFSRQVLGDSKAIERQMSRIIAEARADGIVPYDLDDEGVCIALGLEKFPHLVQIAGDHPEIAALTRAGGHVGIHPDLLSELQQASFDVLMTIENYASFNRAYRELATPSAVFLYTGGWPGRAEQKAIRALASQARRILHWGDIDMAGAAIADAVWQYAGRDIELHMMTPELACRYGQPKSFSNIKVNEDSPAASLIDWLSSAESYALEQEELDPSWD
jgi:hypothetical protein